MVDLDTAVAKLLLDPEDRLLARSILGTDDAGVIASSVKGFVVSELGKQVAGCVLFTQSVGAVFGLQLDDGSKVALKAHRIGETDRWRGFGSLAEVEAAYAIQVELARRGFPCAPVVLVPRPFMAGAAAVMGWLPAPEVPDAPHDPAVAKAMAELMAWTAENCGSLPGASRLARVTLPAGLFPPPHNALFDFGRPGGEWIDARASRARAVLERDPPAPVVLHSDFSCANVKVREGAVAAVYDMDSLCWMDEVRALASAAIHYTYTGDPPWTLPSREEARAFVAHYELARGKAFTKTERDRLGAAAIYAMAYTARCEHGHDGNRGEMKAILADAPDAYFG